MASKKYSCGADGYYQTKVWNGTYTEAMVMNVYSHILAEREDVEGAVNDAINF